MLSALANTCLLLQLINTLRRCKLKTRLLDARQRMQKLFPLNEQLWLDWINDSMANISSEADAQALKQLFLLAMQDYVSVNIWESYLQ
jgi:hypothetical protein